MLTVGITGGIGSGKSTICRIFEVMEVPVFNADAEARRLQNEDPNIRSSMISLFGNEVYNDDGLNRKLVAELVFNNKLLLDQLNKIIHPATLIAFEKWKQDYSSNHYVIKEAAILFESKSNIGLDKIIVVSAAEELRIERIIKRDNISREQIISRMNNQLAEEERIAMADFVIVNDEKSAIIPQVLAVHEKLLAL